MAHRELTLEYNHHRSRWDLVEDRSQRLKSFGTKRAATRAGVLPKVAGPMPISVKIHKENGRLQEERTYPRSSDPRRSKG